MLKELYIENLAIIKSLNINFSSKFTVFTGETGAGKSIILDAINMILGSRGSKDLIRSGEKSCFVSAVFENLNEDIIIKLNELDFKIEKNEELLISRQFFKDSKNFCKINGRPCTVSILKEISSLLITIHGQHDNHSLFSAQYQRSLIDRLAKAKGLLSEYQAAFFKYSDLKKKQEDFDIDELARQRQLDVLSFQINDIKEASLKPDEEQILSEKKKYISNYQTIKDSILQVMSIIDGSEDFLGIRNQMVDVEKCLAKCESIQKIKGMLGSVKEMQYGLEDMFSELSFLVSDMDGEEIDINEIESRLDVIYKIKRKYGNSYDEIMDYLQKIEAEFNELSLYDKNKDELELKIEAAKKEVESLAQKISEIRKIAADKFLEEAQVYLRRLDLMSVRLGVDFKTTELGPNGADHLEFLIATNLGEPLKPIAKVASGGEIARVMLAMKRVLADNDFVDTVIFDEIDIGVSGKAAYNMGMMLSDLSEKKQVVSITHSAQIASMGAAHLMVYKAESDGQTFTKIKDLNTEDRVNELARILGGAKVTDAALENARELLKQKIQKECD